MVDLDALLTNHGICDLDGLNWLYIILSASLAHVIADAFAVCHGRFAVVCKTGMDWRVWCCTVGRSVRKRAGRSVGYADNDDLHAHRTVLSSLRFRM